MTIGRSGSGWSQKPELHPGLLQKRQESRNGGDLPCLSGCIRRNMGANGGAGTQSCTPVFSYLFHTCCLKLGPPLTLETPFSEKPFWLVMQRAEYNRALQETRGVTGFPGHIWVSGEEHSWSIPGTTTKKATAGSTISRRVLAIWGRILSFQLALSKEDFSDRF